MDKSELVELVYEYVEKNKYDKRFIPFIQSYISKCVQEYKWDKKILSEKLNEYTNQIKNIKFLNIGKQRILVDVENRSIILDERIKYNMEDYTLDEYIEASYNEQNKILKTNINYDANDASNKRLRNEIKQTFKIYNRKLMEDKVIFEIINLVQQKNYDKKFIPFIKEYFLRSAEIYNWNRDELEKKINNFKNNVDRIELVKLKNKCAEFNPKEKKIYINKNLLTYTNDIIIKNIFREQGFATNYTIIENKAYENGLYTNGELNNKEKSMNEYAEEVAANYLTGRVPYSNELYTTCRVSQKERKDYNSKTSYVGSMMAAAFGINEFEFAILKDKGRARFDEYFRAKFEYLDTKTYIEEFFKIVYNIENAKESIFSTKEISQEYAKMYNLAVKILNEKTKYESDKLTKDELKNYKIKTNYMKHKIADTLKQAIRNQSLEKRVINENIENKEVIKKYSRISKLAQYKFKKVAKQLYSENDTLFDNRELELLIITEFKFPLIGKIYSAFNKQKYPLLINSNENFDCLDEEEIKARKDMLKNSEIIIPQKEIFEFKEKLNSVPDENKLI